MSGVLNKIGSRSGKIWAGQARAASGGFPAGTKMLFHQTASPTGWTKLTQTGSTPVSFDDCGLRMVTGTITDGVAGSVAFDTAFASQSIPSHTLTTAQIPSHVHGQMGTFDNAQGQGGWGFMNRASTNQSDTTSTGGGGSHGHGSIDINVKYIDMIVASKD
jgi:hypothetical protein